MTHNYDQNPNRVSPRWEVPELVRAFSTGEPNDTLMYFALRLQDKLGEDNGPVKVLDIGAGAGRNAVPLACRGFHVTCVDLSAPMVAALRYKSHTEAPPGSMEIIQSPMAPLPLPDQTFDLIIAHGVWNLSKSDRELRHAMTEAARVAKPGAGLFLFTFSRHTIPDKGEPLPGERYIFTEFGDEPQCFLREGEIRDELLKAGFACNTDEPLTEYNCPPPPYDRVQRPPVIYEAMFTRV